MRLLAIVAVLTGCGDDLMLAPDAGGPDGPVGFVTANHTQLPLLAPHSHSVLDHVQLVTITYSNYADAASVEAFGDEVVSSTWFTDVGAEYGVGAGTHAMKVHLGAAPTTTIQDTTIDTLMQSLVTNHTVPTPSSTGNEYLYMIYIPSSVPLGNSLGGIYGYHTDTTASGLRFPYAVILDDGSGLPTTTATAAHELIESATDPYFAQNVNGDGWYVDPPATDPWYLIEGEVADLCDGEALITSGSFAVQRVWSNAAVTAGKSPCVPYDPDDIWMDVSADPATMPTIARGQSVTFTLTGWSTQPVPDWTLQTADADFADLTSQDILPQLSSTTINNGKTVTLTMRAPATAAHGALGGVYVLSGSQNRPWAVGFQVQ